MSDGASCWHCDSEQPVEQDQIPIFGMRVICAQCRRPFFVLRPDNFYRKRFSNDISQYLLHRKRNQIVDTLEQDIQAILQLEKNLLAKGSSLRNATTAQINRFIQDQIPEKNLELFAETLTEMYQLLLLQGVISANPMESKPAQPAPHREESGVSQDVAAYIQQRKQAGTTDSLEEDLKWVRVLENHLVSQGRTLSTATTEDISLFLVRFASDLDVFLDVLGDCYQILGERGICASNPFAALGNILLHGNEDAKRHVLDIRNSSPTQPGPGRELPLTAFDSSAPTVAFSPQRPRFPAAKQTPAQPLPPPPVMQAPIATPSPYRARRAKPESGRSSTLIWAVGGALVVVVSLFLLQGVLTPSHLVPTPDQTQEKRGALVPMPAATGQPVTIKTSARAKISRPDFFHQQGLGSYLRRRNPDAANPDAINLNPLTPSWDLLNEGRTLFNAHCERCHGSNATVPDLRLAGDGILHQDTYLFWTIAEGGAPVGSEMPAFKDLLSDEQVWTLILFMETLS